MDDTFRGDDAHLVRSIEAHLALDAAGALVPHGVGGLARVLLASAAARLSAALARSGQAASGSSQGARSDRTPSQKLADAGFTRRPSLWALQAREALELIAAPQRVDGSWNRDREACRQLAAEALGRDTDSDVQNGVGQPEAPTVTVLAWKLRRAAEILDRDGDEHGIAADLWSMLADNGTPAEAPTALRHNPACNYWMRPIGFGGCICAPYAANKNEEAPTAAPLVGADTAQAWKWMTHPHWNKGLPIPVLLTTDPDSGEVWYQPFSTSCTEFEWSCRDKEWTEVAAHPPARSGADFSTSDPCPSCRGVGSIGEPPIQCPFCRLHKLGQEAARSGAGSDDRKDESWK